MYWCPQVCIYTQKSTRIRKVYLNYSKCTCKVSILLYKHHAIIESRAIRHSAVTAFTVEFLKRSLASMLMRYCCSMIGCYFFLDIIGSQKRITTYITDRLLVGGKNQFVLFPKSTKLSSDMRKDRARVFSIQRFQHLNSLRKNRNTL